MRENEKLGKEATNVTVPLVGDAHQVFDEMLSGEAGSVHQNVSSGVGDWVRIAKRTMTSQGMSLSFIAPEVREGIPVAKI